MTTHHDRFNAGGAYVHPESVLTPAGPAIIRNWIKS